MKKSKKEQFKDWLNLDYANREFARRLGIPHYQLVEALETADLEEIKSEFASVMKTDKNIIRLAIHLSDQHIDKVIKNLYSSKWASRQRGVSNWRDLLIKHFGKDNMGNWWSTVAIVQNFFKNVRIYIRKKIANNIIQKNSVYTTSCKMWVERLSSKFVTVYTNSRDIMITAPRKTPMFFVEEDYSGRYIFMVGLQHYAVSLTQIQGIVEMKAAK